LDKVLTVLHHQGGRKGSAWLSMVYGWASNPAGTSDLREVGHGTTIKLYLPPARGQIGLRRPRRQRCRMATKPSWWWRDDALVRNRHRAIAGLRLPHGGAANDRRR
jgi:hypothetical protein